ncbi:hypothetical protein [Corallococcus praedator]|uniref:hypothetical protein n=1 Tax=Corallococcus praedator TaxID=2316724 RepID=UPI0013159B37|nr:hypothetical protein [Corallococcus praedator]
MSKVGSPRGSRRTFVAPSSTSSPSSDGRRIICPRVGMESATVSMMDARST